MVKVALRKIIWLAFLLVHVYHAIPCLGYGILWKVDPHLNYWASQGRVLIPTLSSVRSKMVAGSQSNVPPLFLEFHLTFTHFHTNIFLKCNCNQPVLFNAMPNCNGHLYYFQFSRSTVLIGYVGDLCYLWRRRKSEHPTWRCFFSWLGWELDLLPAFCPPQWHIPGTTRLGRAWPLPECCSFLFFFKLAQTLDM